MLSKLQAKYNGLCLEEIMRSQLLRTFQLLLSQSAITCSKFFNRNTRATCEICSKLTIKTPESCYWRRSGVFNVNFEHISHLFLVLVGKPGLLTQGGTLIKFLRL